jgi:predicted dehydrogenase
VALVGLGGRGRWFVDTMPKLSNVVAMCDVNDERAGDAFERVPRAKKYADFRRMLEEMDNEIEGVVIATPDHTHAVIASMAMKMGKHVYCEKPLTHSAGEARFLRDLANQ